jgi:hypothetical protein
VKKAGSSLSFEGERLGVGFEAARTKLREDKKLLETIKEAVTAAASEPIVAKPAPAETEE